MLITKFNRRLTRQDRRGVILGTLVTLVLALFDLSLNRTTNFATSLVMAPFLTAALARPLAVAYVGSLSVTTATLLVVHDTHVGGPAIKVALVALGSALAMLIAQDRIRQETRLARVASVAEAAQRALLPAPSAQVGPAAVAAWYVSATEEALIGGDFFDVVGYQQSARWVIGDVRGKGIEAVRVAAAVLGAFREAAVRMDTLTEITARMDERVSALAGDEDFVTALIGQLDLDGTLTLVNCGHPPPLRVGSALPLSKRAGHGCAPLGLNPHFEVEVFALSPGECLWCFTDGVTEARTSRGRVVDVGALAAGLDDHDATVVASTLRDRLTAQLARNRFEDDTAVLVIQHNPGQTDSGTGMSPGARIGA